MLFLLLEGQKERPLNIYLKILLSRKHSGWGNPDKQTGFLSQLVILISKHDTLENCNGFLCFSEKVHMYEKDILTSDIATSTLK